MDLNWIKYDQGASTQDPSNPYRMEGMVAPGIQAKLRDLGYSGEFQDNFSRNLTSEEQTSADAVTGSDFYQRHIGNGGGFAQSYNGYTMPANYKAGSGEDGSLASIQYNTANKGLVDWLGANKYSLYSTLTPGEQGSAISHLYGPGNQKIAEDVHSYRKGGMDKYGLPIAIAALSAMTGGALGPAVGGMFGAGAGSVGAGAATGAVAGATGGGLGAAFSGDNILEGAAKGGLKGGVSGGIGAGIAGMGNVGAAAGIENPILQGTVNGAISGGAKSLLTGGNIGQGIMGGAASGGAGSAWKSIGGWNGLGESLNFSDQTAAMPADQISAMNGDTNMDWTSSFGDNVDFMSNPMDMQGYPSLTTPGSEYIPSFSQQNIPDFSGVGVEDSDWKTKFANMQNNPIIKSLLGMGQSATQSPNGQPSQGGRLGNTILGSLAGMYLGNQQNKETNKQINNLGSLFGQDSPYAQQLRQQLARKDAASGRRSQYGSREVELQARLAELNSRNAPQLQNLYSQKAGDRNMLYNTLLNNKGLQDLFKQGVSGIGNYFGNSNYPVMDTGNYMPEGDYIGGGI